VRHHLCIANPAERFFRHLSRYLSRWPGRFDLAHREGILGCFIMVCERADP
jgi:hypothetical protein